MIKLSNHKLSSIIMLILLVSINIGMIVFTLGSFLASNNQGYTIVGTISLTNYDQSEYIEVINKGLEEWEDIADYHITYQNIEYLFDLTFFDFNINESINQIVEDEINPFVVTLSMTKEQELNQVLIDIFGEHIYEKVDRNQLYMDILHDAKIMERLSTYRLQDYMQETAKTTLLNTYTASSEAVNHTLILEEASSFIITKNKRFSLLEALNDSNLQNYELSYIATQLMQLSINTHFTSYDFTSYLIDEPEFVQTYVNAEVLRSLEQDFTFYNTYDYDLEVTITSLNDYELIFSLYGYPYVHTYEDETTIVSTIPFNTTYITNELLTDTTEDIIIEETTTDYIYLLLVTEGINGHVYEIGRKVIHPNGTITYQILHYQQTGTANAIYEQNIVAKEG